MVENIYKTPNSDVTNGLPKTLSLKRKMVGTLIIILTAIIYRGIDNAAISFSETFNTFGANLPEFTKFVLAIHGLFLWCAAASLFPLTFWLLSISNQKIALAILKLSRYNLCLALVSFVIFMIAMYLPIFSMGKII